MPKSEAMLDGLLFSQRINQALLDSGVRDIVLAKDLDTESMFESFKYCIRQAPAHPRFYIIWPVDHPLVQSSSLRALIEAASQNPDCIIKPDYRGTRGHPVLVPGNLDFFNSDYETLREVIRYSGRATVIVPVEDSGVVRNLNRPEDLNASPG